MARVSLVGWSSKKLRRKANSLLMCEAVSANTSVGKWLHATNLEMSLRFADHRPTDPLFVHVPEPPTVLSKKTRMAEDPHGMLVMDAKSLYDSLHSEQQNQDDERAALECSLIKEDLETLGGRPRWVPHDKNPADALTKAEGSHFTPMARLLSTARFCIREETEELQDRKQTKEVLGYVPRPRTAPERTTGTWKKKATKVTYQDQELDLDQMS